MLLAIDTSTRMASVALYDESGVHGEHTWRAGQNHTEGLLPRVVDLFRGAGIAPRDLTAVVVALGPGSFNGLRVGLSVAKELAHSLQIPIIGVCTLDALAYQHGSLGLPVRPILEAGREQVATALYRVVRHGWKQIEDPHLATAEDIIKATDQRTLFCGELPPEMTGAFRDRLPNLAVIAPPAAMARRAGYLAELGWYRLNDGLLDDVNTLEPIYLRRPHITQPKPRQPSSSAQPPPALPAQ